MLNNSEVEKLRNKIMHKDLNDELRDWDSWAYGLWFRIRPKRKRLRPVSCCLTEMPYELRPLSMYYKFKHKFAIIGICIV